MKEEQGNLKKTGLPKLLDLIYREGDPAGVLEIVKKPVRKRFFFKDGLPVAATSNVLSEVLGRLLLTEGVITQSDYESSLETVLRDKKRHGEVLISMGIITSRELNSFLTLQLKKRLWNIFGWEEGDWRYTKAVSPSPGMTEFPLDPAELILDGISHGFYPINRIRQDLAAYLDKGLIMSVDTGKYNLSDFGLNLQEKRFLESFNGKKTLEKVLKGTDLLSHRALSLVLAFVITGLVGIAGAEEAPEEAPGKAKEEPASEGAPSQMPEAPAPPAHARVNAEVLFMKARTALSNREYRAAAQMLDEITKLSPAEGEYLAYLGWAVFNNNRDDAPEAERLIKDAIDLNNDLDAAWFFLGMISLYEGREAAAEKAFLTALSRNPSMGSALAELKRIEIRGLLRSDERAGAAGDVKRKRYMAVFSFAEDPFAPEPVDKWTALTAEQSKAFAFLMNGVMGRHDPLLLTGREGSGKTTIALELFKALSDKKVFASFLLTPPEREIDFITAINQGMRAAAGGEGAGSVKEELMRLGLKVSQNAVHGGHTLAVIANAHRLSAENLKLTAHLTRMNGLQVALLADAAFIQRLKKTAFRDLDEALSSRFELKNPVTEGETGPYVLRRLNSATRLKSAGLPLFSITPSAARLLHEISLGLPALMNRNGALILASAAETKTTAIDRTLIERALRETFL